MHCTEKQINKKKPLHSKNKMAETKASVKFLANKINYLQRKKKEAKNTLTLSRRGKNLV